MAIPSLGLGRRFHLATVVACFVFAGSASAADWYVDAVLGNDQFGGSTPGSPWKTLTKAVTTLTFGQHVVHVAPGTYDDALGEVFPLHPYPGVVLQGAGKGVSRIVTTGPFAIDFSRYAGSPHGNIGNDTQLNGFSVSAGQQPILISAGVGSVAPWLYDVEVSGGSLAGITVFGSGVGFVAPLLFRVDSHSNGSGLVATRGVLDVRDSSFSANAGHGVSCDLWGSPNWPDHVQLDLQRCRVVGNMALGVLAHTNTTNDVRFEVALRDSLVAQNQATGVSAWQMQVAQNCTLTIERTTIADHPIFGLESGGLGPPPTTSVDSSILFGNTNDFAMLGSPVVSYSLSGDGDFAGSNGNLQGDPLFVDAPNGDYRLRFGSPCIDSGSAAAANALDLNFLPRPIDGELDTVEHADMGCHEFAPLFLAQTPKLGGVLRSELWGENGATSVLYFTRKPLLFVPQQTSFGQLDLNPSSLGVFKTITTSAFPPTIVQRSIPNSSALVGQTFSFQALTDSTAAPFGKAYTNAYQFTLLP